MSFPRAGSAAAYYTFQIPCPAPRGGGGVKGSLYFCISQLIKSIWGLPLPLALQGSQCRTLWVPAPPSPGLQHMLVMFMGLNQVDANKQPSARWWLGWVPGPPDTSGCISTFPPLLLRTLMWWSEACPGTLVALGPQSALSWSRVGGDLPSALARLWW